MADTRLRHPIVARLRARRRKLGKSQTLLAKEIGVNNRAVCEWEMEQISPTLPKFIKWAESLGLKVTLT